MDRDTFVMVRTGAIAAIISFILYKMTATSLLFIVPLLFVSPKFSDTRWALMPVVAVLIALVGSQLFSYARISSEIPLFGILAVGLYLPVMLLIGAFVWIALKKRRAFDRLLIASLIVAVLGLFLAIWITGDSVTATSTRELYKQTIVELLPVVFGQSMPLGISEETIFITIVNLLRCGFLPLFFSQFGLSVLISEQLINRYDVNFQHKLSYWSIPKETIWPLLISFGGVLFTLLFKVTLLETIFWNLALTIGLMYMVQGISILSALMRRKNPNVSAFRIFLLMLLFSVIPGVNVVPLIALPLLGISETWINLRHN